MKYEDGNPKIDHMFYPLINIDKFHVYFKNINFMDNYGAVNLQFSHMPRQGKSSN